ncbi:hypothetical protein [Geoalkalibacter subterraneus]|uniref:CR-type domain-containing protein n=1 Tax=Geoalkalibacter subterraneus TaxID=483547 RepID=A0A0B5FL88_9BACT|nr:hypothetical protein [Geoalkalibacter subterraneus]AJF08163.1 hypothetical protein GSUB_16815 [Geoalkalibacter subterraneus]
MNIEKVCDQSQPQFRLFRHKEMVGATDGRIILVTNKSENSDYEQASEPIKEFLEKFAEPSEVNHGLPMPRFTQEKDPCLECLGTGKTLVCPECEGSGNLTFSTSHNEYEVDCDTCNGAGRIQMKSAEFEKAEVCEACGGKGSTFPETPVLLAKNEAGNRLCLNSAILHRMKENLENILFYPSQNMQEENFSYSPVEFTFNGGWGVIMPVMPPQEV